MRFFAPAPMVALWCPVLQENRLPRGGLLFQDPGEASVVFLTPDRGAPGSSWVHSAESTAGPAAPVRSAPAKPGPEKRCPRILQSRPGAALLPQGRVPRSRGAHSLSHLRSAAVLQRV
ncbi:hypothetical protein NDU88_007434 [Pleurodeles waltl]|uniref:Uncharacterized protein n=1 Tax=Pleurodeles waltl TaxID=8319 RepID=A0AAV7N498_PLEWA|nr:hypothetical protein NDU88_007434 [Pleurodeles waltl]